MIITEPMAGARQARSKACPPGHCNFMSHIIGRSKPPICCHKIIRRLGSGGRGQFLSTPSFTHNPLQGPIESDPTQRTSETPGANSYGLPLWQACNILDAREGCKL